MFKKLFKKNDEKNFKFVTFKDFHRYQRKMYEKINTLFDRIEKIEKNLTKKD